MTPQSVTHIANGATVAFTFPFAVFEPLDIEVLVNGVVQPAGYTLLGGDGASAGGAIYFASAPTDGTAITIRRTGRAQISGSDAPGFLEDKIVAGDQISITKTFDAAGEHLTIAADIDPTPFQPHNDKLDWLALHLSDAGKELAGASNAAAQRSALGLAAVASSGSYNDLSNKPNLGSVASHAFEEFASAAQGVLAQNALQHSAIGAAVQAFDADLNWLAANLTEAGKELINDADPAAQRATLGLGSAATLAVDADITLAANSDSLLPSQKAVKTYVDVAAGGNITIRDQIALINTRLMLNSSTGTGALIQGRQWELTSNEWGASSTNETYVDASPCHYGNPGTQTIIPGVGDWSGNADYSVGTGTLTSGSSIDASIRTVVSYSGDFSTTATIGGSGTVWDSWGIYDAALDGTFDASRTVPANGGNYYIAAYNGTVYFMSNGSSRGSGSHVSGNTYRIQRSGSTVTVYQNGTLVWTYAQACTATAVKVFLGRGNNAGTQAVSGISFATGGGAPANIILMPPAAISLSAAPTFADAYFLYKDDSGSAVLGTDLTVELSRDGGVSWSPAALTNLLGTGGFDGTYGFVRARANLSAQPSGNSLTCRIKTFNTKAQRIAAPALYAE